MSKLNKIFQSVPVTIPDRSGFDLSHEVFTTAATGTMVPITHFEVLPGDKISMGSALKVTLPPAAVPFLGRIDAELTAAFIPYRLLWKGWQAFITQNSGGAPRTSNSLVNVGGSDSISSLLSSDVPESVPFIDVHGSQYRISTGDASGSFNLDSRFFGPGTLADYLGYKVPASVNYLNDQSFNNIPNPSAMPFLAYHKFCDDWVRDENNMLPFFPKAWRAQRARPSANGILAARLCPNTVGLDMGQSTGFSGNDMTMSPFAVDLRPMTDLSNPSQYYLDGVVDQTLGLGLLRQRCWAKDYFTTANTRPQAGSASSVRFDTSGNTGAFTISTLRAANQLQKWLEKNNISGTDYGSQILAHFGVTPPDAVLDRSVLLGSVRTPVVVNAVESNTNSLDGGATGSRNPYAGQLGSAAGMPAAFGDGSLIDDFEPKEHGIIMVFFCLIPHATYNTGIDRQLLHLGIGDFAFPEFSGLGDQLITQAELGFSNNLGYGNAALPFGYQQRYAEYKFKNDRISGLLADGNNLDVYALQRGFYIPNLGKNFLEIEKDYLDQVLNVSYEEAGFSCIVDAFFDAKAIRVLPEYSLPSL